MKFISSFFLVGLILSSCASKPPQQQENICKIFKDKSSWYRLVNRSEEQWGAPIHVQMSILRQESSFQNRVKPERTKLLGLIPWKRKSSAFGYSQAIDSTWNWYKKERNRPLASRVNFADAVDFTGWYINKTTKILKISKKDAYRQYLAYYKGWGDYKNYKKDKKAIIYAKSVKDLANNYRKQLTVCQKNLNKNKYIIF